MNKMICPGTTKDVINVSVLRSTLPGGGPKLHSEVDLIISSRSICGGLQFESNISRFALVLVCQL